VVDASRSTEVELVLNAGNGIVAIEQNIVKRDCVNVVDYRHQTEKPVYFVERVSRKQIVESAIK
jgi:hypothetical protein